MLIFFKNIRSSKNNFLKVICFITLVLGGALQAMDTSELNEQFLQAAVKGNIDQVAQLLEKGADVNAKNRYGETALTGAAAHGKYDTCQLLITHGASVNEKSRDGRTALINAATGGFKEICALLIKSGADVNAQDRRQKTALGQAAGLLHIFNSSDYKETCKLLIDAMLKSPMNPAQLKPIHLTTRQKSEIYALARSLKNTPIKGLHHDTRRLIIEDVRDAFKRRNFIEAQIMFAEDPFKKELLNYLNSRIEQQIKESPQIKKKEVTK